MTSTALKARDFESYYLEYFMMTSEEEINAFWKRMDNEIVNMNEAEKRNFFQQLDESLKQESVKTNEVFQKVKAALAKK
ncbi:MAG: hypothetical protein K9J37_04590 [Saprospiraceae bacterium]|nr:hypothetical protein [Saprospiraceae bacterium]MCF8249164.1 hypothetical protein [Saprospiraceae bacterium]MCF8278894.1 hypothetical protein [Bacteroidales bacterium]MCF8311293.1 hypothetical protein [Saprospiraceae bacterium]MCF8440143.1 hypothetical protein [Saprospiraceae bacterium]